METNDERAIRATAAIDRYAELAYQGDTAEPAAAVLGDLLTDLRHFADAHGVDFALRDEMARGNYRGETAGDAFTPGQAKASPAEPTTWPRFLPLDLAAFHPDVLDRAQQNQLAEEGYYDEDGVMG